MRQTPRPPARGDEELRLLELARAVVGKHGGREALERLAHLAPGGLPLSSFTMPRPVGPLAFFDPALFADRSAVRAFVRGAEFGAYVAVIQQVLIGGMAVPAESGPIPEAVMEQAREAAHCVLGDLHLFAALAAEGEGDPIAFTTEPGWQERRVPRLAALARVAASLACEGVAPESWQPIFDALYEAAAARSGS